MLTVTNLNAGYSQLQVLWDVNLSVEKGTVTVLIGSNGAGKSTLLKAIAGLIKPYSGEIYFKNIDITGLPAHEVRKLGLSLVPEGKRLFPNLTVWENLLTVGFNIKNEEELRARIEWVGTIFPILRERRNQPARQLSGGEAQMLAITRALVANPELLLVDEPSSELAPRIVETIFTKLNELRDEGLTIFLVDQIVEKALSICDKAYVMENGRIVFSGTREGWRKTRN
jgi:branched-chain amino acid transport system ATP-binding protein